MNHEAPGPAGGRNDFINNRFIAPDEAMSPLYHSAEEILIFAAHSELRAEGLRQIENVAAEKNVPSAAFLPGQYKASRMSWTLVKAAFNQPVRRRLFKVGFYRTKDACNPIAFARPKKIQKLAGCGELVVINERDEVSRGVRQCLVASQRDVFIRLNCIYDFRKASDGFALAFLDNCIRRSSRVVIDDDN